MSSGIWNLGVFSRRCTGESLPRRVDFIHRLEFGELSGHRVLIKRSADDCICLGCPEGLSSRYLYHLLLHHNNYFLSRVRKASVPRLSRLAIENFEIPVPPMAVQRKIVEILDNFSNLTAELEAELEERKRQYEYYRNLLLTFNPVANGAVTGGDQQIGDGFTPPLSR